MKNIIVTGATSFIAFHLIKELLEDDFEIYAIVRPNSPNLYRLNDVRNIHVIELDLQDIEKLSAYVPYNIFAFYHFAWEGARLPFRDNRSIQQKNRLCAIKAINIAKEMNCKIFIGAGSQAEYGPTQGKISEATYCDPDTEYGKAKYLAGIECRDIAKKNNMKFVWPRIFSTYGVYDYSNTLIMSIIKKMKNNESIELTLCTHLWDYIYVNDIAKILKQMAIYERYSGIYNVASGEHRQLKEFVIEIKCILGSDSELLFGAIPYTCAPPHNLMPNIEKLKQALEDFTFTDFKNGISQLLACNIEEMSK